MRRFEKRPLPHPLRTTSMPLCFANCGRPRAHDLRFFTWSSDRAVDACRWMAQQLLGPPALRSLKRARSWAGLPGATVGVLDTGVSRSTCYWAPSSAHLQLKEGSTTQATEKTLTRRRLVRRTTTETAKDQKTSSRALLVRREGTPTSAQHVCVQSKRTTGRRPRTSHATPDREETNFRCACLKRHSGCWPPP
jgi:hypothetical protein